MICKLCPHCCGANRSTASSNGYCAMPSEVYVSRIAPHFWEEPIISGKKGTAAVFFTGCTMNCLYCQNSEISQKNQGVKMTVEEISSKLSELLKNGCETLSFITPTHYIYAVKQIIDILKPTVPTVFNTGGYDSVTTLQTLEGYIDVYLPDFKYYDDKLAEDYSGIKNYFSIANAALEEMLRQTGEPQFDETGILKKGTVVRNLVLPNHTKNSISVINHLSEKYGSRIIFSLMGQYIPHHKALFHPKLNRKITKREYLKVLTAFENSHLDGFCQDLSSASEKYIPNWET